MSELRLAGLKSRRVNAELSMRGLALLVGVTSGAVAAWETGRSMPSADKLPVLAEVLGCSMEELFAAPAPEEPEREERREVEADEGENGVFGAVRWVEMRPRSDAEGRGAARL